MSPPAIRLAGVRRTFIAPDKTTLVALDGLDLEVAPNEVVAVIGPNGSGKSTLLRIAGGLLSADVGNRGDRGTAGHGSGSGRRLRVPGAASPAVAGRARQRRLPARARRDTGRRPRGARPRAARARRPRRVRRRATPPAVGRDAPAGRARPGACAATVGAPARRAVQRPRRADPRAVRHRAARALGEDLDDGRRRDPQHLGVGPARRSGRRPVGAAGSGRHRDPLAARAAAVARRSRQPARWPRPPPTCAPRSAGPAIPIPTRRRSSGRPGRAHERQRRVRGRSPGDEPAQRHRDRRPDRHRRRAVPRGVAAHRLRRPLPAVHPARPTDGLRPVRVGLDRRDDGSARRRDRPGGPARVPRRGRDGPARRLRARPVADGEPGPLALPGGRPVDADPRPRPAAHPVVRARAAEQGRHLRAHRVLPGRGLDARRVALGRPAPARARAEPARLTASGPR